MTLSDTQKWLGSIFSPASLQKDILTNSSDANTNDATSPTNSNETSEDDELLMHTLHTLPPAVKKYWHKRYSLFSRFDDGVYMSSELWYSVTPECTAKFTAKLLRELLDKLNETSGGQSSPDQKTIVQKESDSVENHKKLTVVDVCCGGGGNAIQFAMEFDRVLGIDINKTNVYCTRHNAEVYEVGDFLQTVTGDWCKLCQNPKEWLGEDDHIDVIFCSPPWGGPSYKKRRNKSSRKRQPASENDEKDTNNQAESEEDVRPLFDLHTMSPLNITTLLTTMTPLTRNIALCLPRNTNLQQLSEVTRQFYGNAAKCRVIKVYEYGYVITLLVLLGDIAQVEFAYNEDLAAT